MTIRPPAPCNGSDEEERRCQIDRLVPFIEDVGNQEIIAEADLRAGKDPAKDRINYSKILQIQENVEEIMRIILFEAKKRINKQQREYIAARRVLNRNYSLEQQAKCDALGKELPAIYVETLEKLKQQLGDRDFKKLDAYLDLLHPRREFLIVPPKAVPNPRPPGEVPGLAR